MTKKWKVLKSETILDNYYCKVEKQKVLKPNNKTIPKYFLVSRRDVVMIVPVTTDGKFIVIKEYKHGVKKDIFLFPAGLVDKKENPKDTATRELREETGYTIKNIELLGKLYEFPSNDTHCVYVYLAKDLPSKPSGQIRKGEDVKIYYFSAKEIKQMIMENKFRLATSISAFYLALNKFA